MEHLNNFEKWVQERPYLLIIIAAVSVTGCCFLSQLLLRLSKQCNLSLNTYHNRKRMEKHRFMANAIQSSRLARASANAQRTRDEERGDGMG